MHDPDFQPPVNPLPPVVIALFTVIAGLEVVFGLASAGMIGGPEAIGWRSMAARQYGFHGGTFDWMMAQGGFLNEHALRMVTYPFLHESFTHSLFAMVLLLALGKLVAEVMGQFAVFVIFFGAAVFGAVGYGLLIDTPFLMVGAYPAVYGLIGGYSFILWRKLAGTGSEQYRAFSLIAMLMGLQLIWGMLFETGTTWIAELLGFFCGFGLCFLVAPGEWDRLKARMRRD